MNIVICNNYGELSKKAAHIIKEQINDKQNSVIGLATGSTPLGTYSELIDLYKKGKINFSDTITFNLDEYYRIKKDHPQSYDYFMNENLFNHINIDKKNTHIANGDADNPNDECESYNKMLDSIGGIDLQVLGIGSNGHIGFNEPAQELSARTHLVKLTSKTIEDNSRFFNNVSDVPTQALTMGMADILKAKKIIILISGVNKAKIAAEMFKNRITTQVPASMLHMHPNTTVLIDKDAASMLP